MRAPRFAFVPVSGPGGAGEYQRSLAIARGLLRRWPSADVRFVLNRLAPYAASCPHPALLLDDSPTRSSAAVEAFLRDMRPDVAVFDSAGRLAQYRAVSACGGRVVYVSSRPKTRWKGFRLRRMLAIDQHWIAQPALLGGAPNAWERVKLRLLGRPAIVLLDTLHEPVDEAATRARQATLGIEPGRYVLVCPGGGGTFAPGTDPAAVFVRAARELAARRPEPVVAVVGERFRGGTEDHNNMKSLTILPRLPNGELLGLVRDAAVAAVNGGSLLLQSAAQGVPLVAAPIAADQPARIRRLAAAGCVRGVPLQAAALAEGVAMLLDDHQARETSRTAAARLALRNGVETAVDAVARLLGPDTARTEARR
jgi:hypothetical protein